LHYRTVKPPGNARFARDRLRVVAYSALKNCSTFVIVYVLVDVLLIDDEW